ASFVMIVKRLPGMLWMFRRPGLRSQQGPDRSFRESEVGRVDPDRCADHRPSILLALGRPYVVAGEGGRHRIDHRVGPAVRRDRGALDSAVRSKGTKCAGSYETAFKGASPRH